MIGLALVIALRLVFAAIVLPIAVFLAFWGLAPLATLAGLTEGVDYCHSAPESLCQWSALTLLAIAVPLATAAGWALWSARRAWRRRRRTPIA